MNDQYIKLTEGIVASLEEALATGGVAPWQRPWRSLASGEPHNPFTGSVYSGVNRLILTLIGGEDSRWATFKQISAAKGTVKKGAKGVLICYWGTGVKKAENEDEDDSAYKFLKTYYVFNIADTEGLTLPKQEIRVLERPIIDRCEDIIRNYPAKPSITHGGNRAYYSPKLDIIKLPHADQFTSLEEYYGTLFHECVHSTGHESRLHRLENALFGDDIYSREELVAELGAFFLAHHTQIDLVLRDNQTRYLASWLRVLKEEPRLLVAAASQAQRAVDHILNAE